MQWVDPITLEVISEVLISVVREMRASVVRSAYSSVIYELDDFSCGLFDAKAQMIAQSEDHPGHVIPLPWSVKCAMEDFKDEIFQGDVILLNDPYRGGTHLNDVTILYPIFVEDDLFILPSVREHWADVGGMTPGSYSGLSTSIYQEGLRIPPIKIWERGKPNRAAMDIILSNMRIPEERKGDLNAAISACKTAEKRILDMVKKYGKETILRCKEINLDRSEKRMREKISDLPDGDYFYEDYLEYFNEGEIDPVLLRLKLTIHGSDLTADFTGSSHQVPGVVNSTLAVAGAGVFVAVKSTLDPEGPVNEGVMRPLKVKAPDASIVNVKLDAPAGAHGEVRKRVVSVMLGALSQIIPDLVSGDLCGTSFPNAIGGTNPRNNRPYVYYEAPAGGNGGFKEEDGSSAFCNVDFGNIKTIQPVESIENEFPLMVERYELRTDSGGDGYHRGGLGMRRELRLLAPKALYSVLSDRAVIPPYGVLGGFSSKPVKVSVRRKGEEIQFKTSGKVSGFPLMKDDIVIMQSAGGGGYGDPLQRDVARVVEDLKQNYISREKADNRYGLVVKDDFSIDVEKTRKLRKGGSKEIVRMEWFESGEEPYCGYEGKHRVCKISHRVAEAIGAQEGDLVEIMSKNPAPLRAWISIDPLMAIDAFPLDGIARKILGILPGERLTIRKVM